MQPLYIPHLLQQPQSTQTLHFAQEIGDLATLTPVRGTLSVRHGGTFLEVIAQAEAIVTLVCDRCAQNYNHRLVLEVKELLWLERDSEAVSAKERELSWDDLSETLPPDGHFDPQGWLYEQLNLALPIKNLCGKDCQAPAVPPSATDTPMDHRWHSLAALKQKLSP